jgi:hypothetical protein
VIDPEDPDWIEQTKRVLARTVAPPERNDAAIDRFRWTNVVSLWQEALGVDTSQG